MIPIPATKIQRRRNSLLVSMLQKIFPIVPCRSCGYSSCQSIPCIHGPPSSPISRFSRTNQNIEMFTQRIKHPRIIELSPHTLPQQIPIVQTCIVMDVYNLDLKPSKSIAERHTVKLLHIHTKSLCCHFEEFRKTRRKEIMGLCSRYPVVEIVEASLALENEGDLKVSGRGCRRCGSPI